MWNVHVVNTHNGVRRSPVKVSSFDWERALNDVGNGRATFNTRDQVNKHLEIMDLTEPFKRTWVLCWGDTPVYGGIVTKRTYNKATGDMSVDLFDVWGMFPLRLARDRSSVIFQKKHLEFRNMSLATIAKQVVIAGQGTPSNDWLLSISYPANQTGPHSRTFEWWNAETVQDLLDDLMGVNGGPDIDFRPAWRTDGTFCWSMKAGTLTQGAWEWNLDGEAELASFEQTDDGANTATAILGSGEGSEKNMIIAHGKRDDLGFEVERRQSYPSLKNSAQVMEMVEPQLQALSKPTRSWSGSMKANGRVSVTDLMLGGKARFHNTLDPVLPQGWTDTQLIHFSGSLGFDVNLTLQTR